MKSVILLLAVLLVGCTTDPYYQAVHGMNDVAIYQQQCAAIGYAPNTNEFRQCTLKLLQAHQIAPAYDHGYGHHHYPY